MSLTKDQILQVLAIFSESDDDGGRKFKVNVEATVADAIEISQDTPGTTNGVVVNSGTITAVTDITNPVVVKEAPDASNAYTPTADVSAAYEASSVSKASPGVLYNISGYNSGPAQFLLVFNSTTVPANGAVTPYVIYRLAATSVFSFTTGKFGMYFGTGISWSNSTDADPFTKALGATDCFVNLQFK